MKTSNNSYYYRRYVKCKVFVVDLIAEEVYESVFGSDEYIEGMKFVIEDDDSTHLA